MKILGIQIKGKVVYNNGEVAYITDFEEMVVDTDKNNRIITKEELLNLLNKEAL